MAAATYPRRTVACFDRRGCWKNTALAQALNNEGPRARTPGLKPLGSITELKAWLDRARCSWMAHAGFGQGHWFVAVGYDQNGVYTRDSSGWDTRYLTWSRLYGEVGFSGWVVGVSAS